ncbi:hypothetical protein KIN20_019845 [Parelaphostrongylus tenuis]|uniref:Uncharacterized protein n=1 Tax=Parelaphostrongylus tenuis TaxID=148309 RepID=A0AAD5MLP6_PARTN|nr:hypothetical protein KIN20_019845 [Parelaphostrongylus tenuis]
MLAYIPHERSCGAVNRVFIESLALGIFVMNSSPALVMDSQIISIEYQVLYMVIPTVTIVGNALIVCVPYKQSKRFL